MNESFEVILMPIVNGMILTLTAAFVASPVALLVLLFDRLVGQRVTARVRCWLWLLVAIRLLMPIAPGSPVSVQYMWRLVPSESGSQAYDLSLAGQGSAENSSDETLHEFLASETPSSLSEPFSQASEVTAAPWEWDIIVFCGMALLWLTGVTVVLLRAIVASLRFARRLRGIPEVKDDLVIDLVLRVCDQLDVRRRPRVKYVPGLPAPALFGLWRTTLCLPEETRENLSSDQLRMIVLHEAMHLRRGDGYTAWLLTLVRAFHWFNPVAWYTVRQVETYRELACDDAVRQFTQPQERSAYTDLLLRFASGRPAASLGLLGLWFACPTKGLSMRLEAFTAKDGNSRRLPRLASGALVVLLTMVGLTDAANTHVAESVVESKPPVFSASNADAWLTFPSHWQGTPQASNADEVEEREYDLTAALEKIDDVPGGKKPKEWLLIWAKAPGSHSLTVRTNENDPNRVTITMPQSCHTFFSQILDEISRVGHVSQVVVETRVMSSEHVEKIVAADLMEAVKFSVPEPASYPQWAESEAMADDAGVSLSVEGASYEYAPYTALILDEDKMIKLTRYFQIKEKASLSATPKVTLFSGQPAMIADVSRSPFVTGVEYIRGEFATAAQPNITVIPEGMMMNVQTLVLEDDTIDLRLRLTLSSIGKVGQAKLPGAEVTVQMPKVTRRTVTARCRLKPGETLLVAPLAGKRNDNQKTYYYAISARKISE